MKNDAPCCLCCGFEPRSVSFTALALAPVFPPRLGLDDISFADAFRKVGVNATTNPNPDSNHTKASWCNADDSVMRVPCRFRIRCGLWLPDRSSRLSAFYGWTLPLLVPVFALVKSVLHTLMAMHPVSRFASIFVVPALTLLGVYLSGLGLAMTPLFVLWFACPRLSCCWAKSTPHEVVMRKSPLAMATSLAATHSQRMLVSTSSFLGTHSEGTALMRLRAKRAWAFCLALAS